MQLPESIDAEKAQASIYGDIFAACLSEKAFDGVTTWGFTDLHSWRVSWSGRKYALPLSARLVIYFISCYNIIGLVAFYKYDALSESVYKRV